MQSKYFVRVNVKKTSYRFSLIKQINSWDFKAKQCTQNVGSIGSHSIISQMYVDVGKH